MNMMNTMRRGLATTAMSLVCLMAGTMNTLAATDAGTELVSQIDAAAGEETNGTSTEAAQTPSGPASDPELIRKQTNAAAEEAADTNASEAEVAAFSNESAQVEAENADEAAMTENTDTNAAAEAQEAEAPAEIYAGRFTTTAYCSCRRCCRGGKNRTKSGTFQILKSCGSSSRRVLRRKCPTGRIRSSCSAASLAPVFASAFWIIVRNLQI